MTFACGKVQGEDNPSWLARSLLDADVDLSVPGVREDLWTAAAGMYNAAIDTVRIRFDLYICGRA